LASLDAFCKWKVNTITDMSYMFSDCTSLINITINNLNTSSVINMENMFANCKSLISINLSNFNFDSTQNMENMFANDIKLVYVNLQHMNDQHIKRMNNMFYRTLDNMVFCINESISSYLYSIIKHKSCTAIDCSNDWIKSRRLLLSTTNECVDKCPEETKYIYDNICYLKCPGFTLPDGFICKESVKEFHVDEDESCGIRNYFLGNCKKIFANQKKNRNS